MNQDINEVINNLTEYYQNQENCLKCPVSVNRRGQKMEMEHGWGTPGNVLFIGQCPSFVNPYGKAGNSSFDIHFKSLIQPYLNPEEYFFTNLIKVPVKINEMAASDLKHGAGHVQDEINLITPKVIFALGKFAYHACKEEGIKVHGLIHPGAIKYGTTTEDQWKLNFESVFKKYEKLIK